MTKRASSLFLSLSLTVSSLAWAQSSSAVISNSQSQIDEQIAQRQNAARDAMIELQKARQSYGAGRYTEAEESYRKALSLLPHASATQKQREFIQKSLADALVAKAIDYRKVGRTDEAISFLEEAIELSPLDKRAQQELAFTQDPIRQSPALTPEHVGNVREVDRLLTLGYAQYDLGNFDDAERSFLAVVDIDPYNMAARRGISAVNERKSSYYRESRSTTRSSFLADIDAEWEMKESEKVQGEIPMDDSDQAGLTMTSDASADVMHVSDALDAIILPQIILDQATVSDLVDVLNGQIRTAAAQATTPSGRPINVMQNFGLETSDAYQTLDARRLNLSLSNVSLRTVLDMASRQLGIQYELLPAGIELTYSGTDFGPIRTRHYTVHPSFFSSNQESVEDDDFGVSGGARLRRVKPQEQLERLGVHFPAGSSARYSAATQTLTVSNTSHNLKQVDEVVSLPFMTDRQVMLNVYSMEVSEKHLEDLGFEWLLSASISDAVYSGGGVLNSGSGAPSNIDGTGQLVTSGLRSGKGVLSNASIEDLIAAGSAENFAIERQSSSPNIFGFRGVWSGADLSILMRGLNQKTGVDNLYNPQVIFSPGEERQVIVANVREFYVPSEYTAPELQSSSNSGNSINDLLNQGLTLEEAQELFEGGSGAAMAPIASPAHPSEFEFISTTEDQFNGVGTTLAVHRVQVLNEGESMIVDISAAINEFDGFVNWGVPIRSGVTNDTDIESIVVTENRIVQPVFNKKFVNTSLEVAPGDVVVFAALHDAKVIKYEDKVPILGDIPLMGRLFRSEGTSRDKRVLLFFARVDLMDPTGVDVTTGERPAMAVPGN